VVKGLPSPVLIALLLLGACKNDRTATSHSDAASAPMVAAPVPTRSAPKPPPPTPPPSGATLIAPLEDAGAPGACKLIYGPAQQALTGPATLVASARGLEVVQHKSGLAVVTVVPITPAPAFGIKPSTRVSLPEPPKEKASKPACAVAGPYAFCSDAQGQIHRSRREMASDDVIARAIPGGRVAAASIGDAHIVLGTVSSRRTSEGEFLEAWVKLDDKPAVRLSEDGAGASDVVFAARKPGEVVTWMIDARVSMTPVHMRTLKLTDKLELGPDIVVHVAGGTTRILQGALATSDQGAVVGLLAAGNESAFGLLSIPLEAATKEYAPFAFSPYPNGYDGAPLAATAGGRSMLLARVRPSTAPGQPAPTTDGGAALPNHVLELGRLDGAGAFQSLGLVSSMGSVSSVATELDSFGALWVYYTDAGGSWLERRVCR
jgi:hypothetical protein